ncbi:chalcone-flavanone isomerase-domain-containing protein [Peziza echinospora]|nr:chalcone-flavanone isomerase-domain-containing protein [Peziza echinospora]
MTGIGIVTYLISNTVPAPNTITTSSTPEKERKEYKYLPNPHKAEASTTSTAPPLPTTQLPEGIPLRYTITDSFTAAAEAKARESKTKNEDDDKCKEKVDSVKGTYVLLGHGIRTVSFLSIKVYDAGMYIHEEDLPLLKKYIATLPTTTETTTTTTTTTNPLTPLLTSPTAASEKTLDALLNTGIRTLFLIHPARNTDWAHLRDGWIRGIKARKFTADQDEELGDAVAAFREMFVRTRGKSVEKGGTILLVREGGAEGGLQVWFDGSTAGMEFVGRVGRPIVARALWGGYLAGPRVSSEELRGRVVEGLGKGGEVSV